jgi:hypothetical protein
VALGLIVCVAIGVGLAAGAAHAETPSIKAGIGFGSTSYRATDELRDAQHRPLKDTAGQPLEDNGKIDVNQGNWHAFLEWYPEPSFAFGLQAQQAYGRRSLGLAWDRTATWFGRNYTGETYEEQVQIAAWFLTATWVPVRGNAFGLGMTGGLGQAAYSYRQYVGSDSGMGSMCWFGMMCGGHHENQFGETAVVTTPAALAGIFLDLGRTLGIRIGVNYTAMPVSTLTARQPAGPPKDFRVDGSGITVYLDARIGS